MTMLIYRNEDLSMFYFIKNMFSDTSYIEIVDSFPADEFGAPAPLTIPTISIDAGKLKEELFELGDRDKVRIRTWYIDIFAKNKSQRDDFGYRILDQTKNGININDYNQGFPPTVTPSKIGHMDVLSISYEPVPVMLDKSELLYFRGQVILVTQNDTV
jgi:hypothetical protein